MSTEAILKLRIAELRQALRPFAREAEQWSEEVPDYYRPLCTEPGSETPAPGSEASFTIGDLRRAKALLEKPISFEQAPSPQLMPAGDMTLRDWLAGQALAGLLANSALEGSYEGAALGAYAAADAMLAQREQASAGSKPKLRAHRCHECDRPLAGLATYRTEDGRKICGDCWLLELGE